MHIQTHALSGWCIANCFPLTADERLACMAAATVADLDGLSLFGGRECYWTYHHAITHNLAFGLVAAGILTALTSRRLLAFAVFLGLYHAHLLMDTFGSGEGWGYPYFWPFSHRQFSSRFAWPFYSWQNLSAGLTMILWTCWLAAAKQRTPLERVMPNLDRQLVALAVAARRRLAAAMGAMVSLLTRDERRR